MASETSTVGVEVSDLNLIGEGYELPATLVLAPKAGQCIVFFAGSGPTDRNWLNPMLPGKNGSAAQLAALAGLSVWPFEGTVTPVEAAELRNFIRRGRAEVQASIGQRAAVRVPLEVQVDDERVARELLKVRRAILQEKKRSNLISGMF